MEHKLLQDLLLLSSERSVVAALEKLHALMPDSVQPTNKVPQDQRFQALKFLDEELETLREHAHEYQKEIDSLLSLGETQHIGTEEEATKIHGAMWSV